VDFGTENGGDTAVVERAGGDTLTDEHHDWVTSTLGVDPRSYASNDGATSAADMADTAAAAPAPAATAQPSGGFLGALSDAADSVKNDVSNAAGAVVDAEQTVAAGVVNVAESAADTVTSTVAQAQSAVEDAETTVEDAVGDAASSAKATVTDAVATATQDIEQGEARVEDAVSDLGGTALDASAATDANALAANAALAAAPGGAEPLSAGLGLAVSFDIKAKVPKADLEYFDAEGSVAYKVTYEPAVGGDPDVAIKFENGQAACEAALKTKFGHDVTLKGGGKVSQTKGELSAELEIETSERTKTTFAFEAVDVDAKEAKVKFAELKWTNEYTLVSGTFDIPDLKIKYSGKVEVEVDFEPKWAKLAKSAADKFGEELTTDLVVDAAFNLALAAVAVGVIAACADAFVQLANLGNLKASLAEALRSMNTGLTDGLSGKDAAGTDPIYQQFWTMGSQAYHAAAEKAVQAGLSLGDLEAEAKYQADKAIKSWPGKSQAEDEIRWAFFRKWVAENHGLGTFEGDAQDAVYWCFGVNKEAPTGPHMSYWAKNSNLPQFFKT